MYRVEYQNRNEFIFLDMTDNCVYQLDTRKRNFFHNDIVDEKGNVVYPSNYREKDYKMTGVLQLNSNTFHGKYKNKFLYTCIPNDIHLPVFYIPYKQKYNFSKSFENLYVVFELKEFHEKPIGQLIEVIGSVNNIHNYFLYELKSRNLWYPQKKFIIPETQLKAFEECCSTKIVQDRTLSHTVFTIDPEQCRDFDDAISIHNNVISVYISNVPVILDCLQYYGKLTEQVATIYLPNMTRNMLPNFFSEGICSLVADNTKKAVFYMDIFPDETIQFGACWVKIHKNYVYEEKSLLENPDYQKLLKYAILKSANPIINSHDVVQFFMIFMNHECAFTLRNGIYRSTKLNTRHFCLHDYFGEYVLQKSYHDALQLDCYGHFTSPIRRLVDIVNLTLLQSQLRLCSFEKEALEFCKLSKDNIDHINNCTRSIRKLEQNAFWLNELETLKSMGINYLPDQKVDILEKERINCSLWKYTVFLKERKRVMTLKTPLNYYKIGDSLTCYLYYFQNEDNLKKKVRLQISN